MVTLNSPGRVSTLREVFSICQQITVLIYFLLHISLFGDLLVPPPFACNLN